MKGHPRGMHGLTEGGSGRWVPAEERNAANKAADTRVGPVLARLSSTLRLMTHKSAFYTQTILFGGVGHSLATGSR